MKSITRDVIDLHCDALFECGRRRLGFDAPELQFSPGKLPQGFRLCQLLAAFVPDSLRGDAAEEHFMRLAAIFTEQLERRGDMVAQVRSGAEISAVLSRVPVAAMLTIEGGAAFNGKLQNVRRFYDMGVRLVTLTWNGENELGGGAGTDVGLKPFGRAAVAEMERLGMAVDASHLSDRAFRDLCETAQKPFVASHSNARAVCGHPRNLTDEMFLEIARRGGVTGLNFCRDFIREDGADGTVDDLLRHAHHFLELGGEDAVCLGSDFDGCETPDYLRDGISRLEYLAESLERSGIPAAAVDKIMFGNAHRYFTQLGEQKI